MGDGEDGPTHQPVEHLASLRAIPGLVTLRPGDANEVVEAYRYIMQLRHQPAVLALSRQPLPTLDRSEYAPASGVARGAYVLADAPGANPEVILIASGSEVILAVRCSREADCRRHPFASGLHAVVGYFRKSDQEVPRQRAAAGSDGADRDRAGLDFRMGAIRRLKGRMIGMDDVRGLGAAQGTPEKVRLRAGPRRLARQGTAGQGVSHECRLDHATFWNGCNLREAPRIRQAEPSSRRDAGPRRSQFQRLLAQRDAMELLLFDRADDGRPARVIPIDPSRNRTYHYWHVFVPGFEPGQIYGYRVTDHSIRRAACASIQPRSCSTRTAAASCPEELQPRAARLEGDNTPTAMKSVVVDPRAYDWEGDKPLRRPSSRTIIYEMHVRGFTAIPAPASTEAKRGTYAGLIEKIPYLQQLGITAVELLPVFQFDAQDCPPGLVNYWGYAPVSFFAPHQAYSSRQDPLGPVDEFRDMVKALHRAGIEVILDVVFNHTAEGDHRGPTLCFRGLDNGAYYILEQDRSRYANYSGTGNTLNANHPIVRRMIVDSLRYWVEEMHVDGFRFDLASILARDSSGTVDAEPAGAVGHRIRPGAGRHEDDCRSLGCGRAVPGGQLRRRQLEGVERAVPRRCPRLLPRRRTIRWRALPTACSAARRSTATRSAKPSRASTS